MDNWSACALFSAPFNTRVAARDGFGEATSLNSTFLGLKINLIVSIVSIISRFLALPLLEIRVAHQKDSRHSQLAYPLYSLRF